MLHFALETALHIEGLIEKVNGKGSFVRRPGALSGLDPLTGFYETMRRLGHTVYGKVSPIKPIKASELVATALNIPIASPVSSLTIIRMVDGEPYARHIVYGSSGLLSRLAGEDLCKSDVITVLQDQLNYRIGHTDLDISALHADARVARQLGMADGAAVLRLLATVFDVSNLSILFNEFIGRSDRLNYRISINR